MWRAFVSRRTGLKRLEALVAEGREQLVRLEHHVAQAVVAEFSEASGLPMPNDDDWEQQQLFDLVDKGFLTFDDDGRLFYPAMTSPSTRRRG